MFREDKSFEEALRGIYTSSYMRSIRKGVPYLIEKNVFYKDLYSKDQDGAKKHLAHYWPSVDYDQFIYVDRNGYNSNQHTDYYDKVLVFNVVEYNFSYVVVGTRTRISY